jgi:hypothetical protein
MKSDEEIIFWNDTKMYKENVLYMQMTFFEENLVVN